MSFRLLATIVFLALVGFASPTPAVAAPLDCGYPAGLFGKDAGNVSFHTGSVRGGKAAIEYFDPAVCTPDSTFPGGASGYWVGVVGSSLSFNDIYQVGVWKCTGTNCISGWPVNQTFKFWAYGHEQSDACGPLVLPKPRFIANISSGTLTYKIVREYFSHEGYFYDAYISTSEVQSLPEADLTICWGTIDNVSYLNEVKNEEDQSGGQSGNTQTFQSAYWYDGSTWHQVTGTTGAWCDRHDLSTMGCKWHSTDNTLWNSWDNRF